MDPDTLRAAQAWHIPMLRFSGNYSSGYHWRDGVGPHEARPTVRNVAWGGVDTHRFGTDELLDLAHKLGAATQIGVNAGNGTPEEAAAWVRYCNDPTERVSLWEIGNELYGGWQIGHTDAAGNAERFVRFRDAMRQADPHIEIMATGKGDEFNPDGVARDTAWNEAVLHAAVANGGPAPDYLTLHPLVPLPGGLGNLPYAEVYESAMAHPAFLDQTLIPDVIQSITSIEGPDAKTKIAPTEWGLILGGDGWERVPNHNVLSGAIYSALTLNTFLRHGDWVTLANATALFHGGCIQKDHGVVYVNPQYYTSQLYAAAHPRTPVQTDWTGPGRDVPQRGFLPAATNVSDVDVFSALTADNAHLVAFVVNRHLNEARPIALNLTGFPASAVTATVLTSPDPQAINGWYFPDNVRPQPFPIPAHPGQKALTATLPPHSVVVFTFRR
jgi:alpha-N-arabinofuranosidase